MFQKNASTRALCSTDIVSVKVSAAAVAIVHIVVLAVDAPRVHVAFARFLMNSCENPNVKTPGAHMGPERSDDLEEACAHGTGVRQACAHGRELRVCGHVKTQSLRSDCATRR